MSWITKAFKKIMRRKPKPVRERPHLTIADIMTLSDRVVMDHALKDPATLHPSVALSVRIETEAMVLRQRSQDLVDRFPTPEALMEECNRLDGTVPGTNGVHDRIAKTDEEYNNRIFPSTGKTEAQMDAWNALMTNGGRVMLMGKDKPAYIEVNPRQGEERKPQEIIDLKIQHAVKRFEDQQRKGLIKDELPALEQPALGSSSLSEAGQDDLSASHSRAEDPAEKLGPDE